jgi:mannose-6-phosphate isomerase-like protein (cupin superfamily)
MIIKYSETNKKERGPMKISGYKINPNFSGALIEIDGRHGKIKSLNENRIYFIIEGSGKFIISGKEENISDNDLVFIPRNTPYDIIGKLKYFLICFPEFNQKNDISLE